MTRADRFLRRLSIEPLENRQLLCGAAAGGSILQSAAQSALLARSHQSAAVSVSASKHNSGGGSSDENSNQSFLVTTLTNSAGTVEGTASFATDTNGNQKLVITVVGAAASTSYAVSVNGTTDLGTLTTDANGNGKLVLTSAATTTSSSIRSALSGRCGGGDSNTTTGTLPTGFTLSASDVIALTSATDATDVLNGTFAVSTGSIGDGDGEGCHGGDHGATVARSVATLSDSASVTGKAVFTTITHADGSTDQILRVRITGAEAGATLDVSVDGTSIGSITADDSGNAYATFSTNPKTSNVGQLPSGLSSTPTSIAIGTTITGTFSTATLGGSSSLASIGRLLLSNRR